MDDVSIVPAGSQIPTVVTDAGSKATPASSVGMQQCVDYFVEKVGGQKGTNDINGFRYAGNIYVDFEVDDNHGSLLCLVAQYGYDEILGNMLELGANPEMGKKVSLVLLSMN